MKSTCLETVPFVLRSVFLAALITDVAWSEAFDMEQVEMIGDNWGYPHIFAHTPEDAFLGLGYRTAEDCMFQEDVDPELSEHPSSEYFEKKN